MLTRREKDQWLDEKDRREGLASLFYFGKYILGYDLEENPHRRVCDFVQSAGPLALQLLPRGSYKTTVISQIYPVWLIISNPDIRILLDSVVLRNSERNLAVIKSILERNERLKYLYGDFVNKDKWTQGECTVSKRKNFKLKEPTVGTSSVDTTEVGPHWDVIIPDDLHNEDNTRNKDQIDRVHEHFKLLFSLLEPGGIMRIVGTRWADLDLYGRIKEQHDEFKVMEAQSITPSKYVMLADPDAVIPDDDLFFPSKLNTTELRKIKKIQGSEMFSAQYQNDPVPDGEDARFQKKWFKYGENRDCPLYMAIDPSISQGPTADYFSMVIGGTSRENELFIEHYIYGRWQPYDAMDKMFNLIDRYRKRLRVVGIEVNAFQKMLKFAFEVEMRKRNKFIKVVELRHQKSKEERILSLQPRYECGAVYHKAWMKDSEIEEELVRFPKGRRDDVIDAAASLLEIIPARSVFKSQKREIPPEDAIQRMVWNRRRHDRISKGKNINGKGGSRFIHDTLGGIF